MGIFSKLFTSSSDIEKQLEKQYLPMFQTMMGMPSSQAKSNFYDILKQAEEESLKEGTSNLPQNFGDILLEKESANDTIKSMLTKLRREGVRDEDIRWWWNMHDLERRMMLKVDEAWRMALYLYEKDKGIDENKAAEGVRKFYPIYGNPTDISHTTSDDRSLLPELKDRINIYIEKRKVADPEEYKREIENSSTFNALIRKEIRKGNI